MTELSRKPLAIVFYTQLRKPEECARVRSFYLYKDRALSRRRPVFDWEVLPTDIRVVYPMTLLRCVLRCHLIRENVPNTLLKITSPVMLDLLPLLYFSLHNTYHHLKVFIYCPCALLSPKRIKALWERAWCITSRHCCHQCPGQYSTFRRSSTNNEWMPMKI